jgi:hypothetical protein
MSVLRQGASNDEFASVVRQRIRKPNQKYFGVSIFNCADLRRLVAEANDDHRLTGDRFYYCPPYRFGWFAPPRRYFCHRPAKRETESRLEGGTRALARSCCEGVDALCRVPGRRNDSAIASRLNHEPPARGKVSPSGELSNGNRRPTSDVLLCPWLKSWLFQI